MSAPSNDISTLGTVIASCSNLIKTAEDALASIRSLKKVILLEHVPRFDSQKNEKLAKHANITLSRLLKNSAFSDKIDIGSHSFSDFGAGKTHCSRFKNSKTGHYDGIHYFGPSGSFEITKSISNIILSSLPREKLALLSKTNKTSHSIPVHNQFAILEGNC